VIVDVIATCDEAFSGRASPAQAGLDAIAHRRRRRLYNVRWQRGRNRRLGQHRGRGCGIGGKAAFIGQTDDQLGKIFAHDMRALGVRFDTLPLEDNSLLPTGAASSPSLLTPSGR
jgi:hypothetical protein